VTAFEAVPLIKPPALRGVSNWAPGGDAGEQAHLPAFQEAIARSDANHDGKLAQSELPKEWQPTGSWGAIDLDRDGLLNERDWNFFRARRAAQNSVMAIRLGGKGDLTDTNVLWRYSKVLPDVPCPLIYKGVLYLVKTGGIATSLNPATGAVLKQARLMNALDGYYSSPVGADGKVYMISEAGKVSVLKAGAEWEVLALNDLAEDTYATPAVSEGKIYLRTRTTLYCFASR
jgi:outer membrane protein assembly factor BamB